MDDTELKYLLGFLLGFVGLCFLLSIPLMFLAWGIAAAAKLRFSYRPVFVWIWICLTLTLMLVWISSGKR